MPMNFHRDVVTPSPQQAVAEFPDDGELELWRATADDLLRARSDNAGLTRRAAFLLQNAYLFARALAAPMAQAAAGASELRAALQECIRAMDVARDTIQPITVAQMKLHGLNPDTANILDAAAAKALAALAPRSEADADRASVGGVCSFAHKPQPDHED